jgi:hypothetical protein
MRSGFAALIVVVVASTVAPPAGAQQEPTMMPSEYVVMPHMKGTLALQVSSITGLWYLPAAEGKPAQLRVSSQALVEAKALTGADAESLWAAFRVRDEAFLFVGHMGGTLAIPRAQVRTAYYSEDTGSPRLRLGYDGDPSGKTLEGEEAATVWKAIRR